MWSFAWPIALIVASNILYQICAKSVPVRMNPFASLTITYVVAAVFSAIFYYGFSRDTGLLREYAGINWAPFVLGLVIVGLEVGFIYAYKAGWPINAASITASSFLAVALIFVGFLLYKESLSADKIFGILICLVGLYFINR